MVPTAREAHHVRPALRLGRALGVPTVLMCSHESNPRDVVAMAADTAGAEGVVLDLGDPTGPDLPPLATAEFSAAMVGSRDDLALKRNLGLLLGRLAGWRAVLFLDDDIDDLSPRRVRRAVGALEQHTVVGLPAVEFPDNSVVCHARRLSGARQGVFVSGSALAVRVDLASAFFPETYNEDWLFLAPHLADRTVTAVGSVSQEPFNPFRYPHRATAEEFGDVLGEGLLASLHHGSLDSTRSTAYWRHFLRLREAFIAQAYDRCRKSTDRRAVAALPALEAAERQRARIAPDVLSDYVAAWNTDLATWRAYLSGIPSTGDLPAGIKRLGLPAGAVRQFPALRF